MAAVIATVTSDRVSFILLKKTANVLLQRNRTWLVQNGGKSLLRRPSQEKTKTSSIMLCNSSLATWRLHFLLLPVCFEDNPY